MIFKKELDARICTDENDLYKILGTEIRLRRIKLSKTLADVAQDCSVSYLCKVERHLINPNPKFISSICERLDISKQNLMDLYNLKQLLINSVKAFYTKDEKELNDIYNRVKDFENYRSSLIVAIYYLFNKNYLLAKNKLDSVYKIKETMIEYDFFVLSVFYTILEVKEYKYFECIRIFEALLLTNCDEYLKALVVEYISKCLGYITSKRAFEFYEKAIDFANKTMNYDRAIHLEFEKITLYLKLNDYESFNRSIVHFKDERYRYTLDNYSLIIKKIKSTEKIRKEMCINDFSYYIILYCNEFDRFKIEFEDANYSDFEGMEYMLLKYLSSETDEEIGSLYYPFALNSNNVFFVKYFGKKYLEQLYQLSQYKKSSQVTQEMFNLAEKAYLY